MFRTRFMVVHAAMGVGVVCALACSPDPGSGSDKGSVKASGSGKGTGGGSGSDTADGGLGNGLGAGTGFTDFGARDGGTGSDKDANCGALVLEPEAVKVDKEVPSEINCTADSPEPISLYLVLDNSGSMKDNNKWTDAVSAITAFVNSDPTLLGGAWKCLDKDGNSVTPPADLKPPGTGAISVAIQYFHPINVGSNPNECDGSGHSTPAVPMGELPANGVNITNSLAATGPTGNTPTVGALTGGTKYCTDYQTANPGKKCVVVLITDGQPNDCGLSSKCGGIGGGTECVDPKSAGILTPIAGVAFNQANSVRTFTVGMSGVNAAGFDLLNAIAVAGGSDCTPPDPGNETCNVTTSGSKGFLDALNTIRNTVQVTTKSSQTITTTVTQTTTLPCEWGIPTPDDGKKFDKTLVNVNFTSGGAEERLGNVNTMDGCAAAGGGWYYDDVDAPTRILSCPDTCTRVKTETGAKVEVLLGCPTEKAIAR